MINVFNKKNILIILVIILIIISIIMINKTKENIKIQNVSKLLGFNSKNIVSEPITNINFSEIDKNIIFMWHGDITAIPTGWALCDGTTKNNIQTPDLRGRFIVGASDLNNTSDKIEIKTPNSESMFRNTLTNQLIYKPEDTGGFNFPSLDIEQMPRHHHETKAMFDGGTLLNCAGGGTKWLPKVHTGNALINNYLSKGGLSANIADNTSYYSETEKREISQEYDTKPFDNRPKYYVLAYIIYVGVASA